MKEMYEKLKKKLKGAKKVVFMGIGEEKLSDDGVGPYIISELMMYNNEKFLFINAGINPMLRIDQIIEFQPSHLIIIDTCTVNQEPGTVAILERENMCDYIPISTHTIPIHLVIDLILEKLPNLSVFMIGIVPKSLEGFTELKLYKNNEYSIEVKNINEDIPFFEIQLTDIVKNTADNLIEIIKKIIKDFIY
jgi:hydrogenase maturation protease HycI